MSVPLSPDDPCYPMLLEGLRDPSKRSTTTVYRQGCYICDDPEFALMGLPLCYPCKECGAHVPADDSVCDNGHDNQPEMPEEVAAEYRLCEAAPHLLAAMSDTTFRVFRFIVLGSFLVGGGAMQDRLTAFCVAAGYLGGALVWSAPYKRTENTESPS